VIPDPVQVLVVCSALFWLAVATCSPWGVGAVAVLSIVVLPVYAWWWMHTWPLHAWRE
jgi:hypothetical protein